MSGAQGIGKSTAIQYARDYFRNSIAVLGLDEFYLTKAERIALAENTHPLFEVRGPAGTHDLDFLNATIDDLLKATPDSKVRIPKFLKAIDDRAPENDWDLFSGRPSAILVEGWCIGAEPDLTSRHSLPINAVEKKDESGAWREYQERELAGRYAKLWDRADAFFHICAPSFEQVLDWRTQQEETTLGLTYGSLPKERRDWVHNFIQHYERVTKRMLNGGKRGGYCLQVNANREPIIDVSAAPPAIIFSDLDGTLLDHKTYGFDEAKAALQTLRDEQCVLVLASSKTAAEIAPIRQAVGFAHCPAIVENGCGVLEPGQSADDLNDTEYQKLLNSLNDVPTDLREKFVGFSNWNAKQISEQTGLNLSDASLAKKRCFSEPGKWLGTNDELAAFLDHLSQRGVSSRQGGRFLTLSFGSTKADQMANITSRYLPAPTIALGDAPNDVEMINTANYGVVISNSHGTGIKESLIQSSNFITRTRNAGPRGWNEAVLVLMSKLGISE